VTQTNSNRSGGTQTAADGHKPDSQDVSGGPWQLSVACLSACCWSFRCAAW